MEVPRFPMALCSRCKFLVEPEVARFRKHYMTCGFPVKVPAVLRANGFHEGEWDRLIPRRELVGLSDASRYNNCPTFASSAPKKDAPAEAAKDAQKPELVEVDPRLYDLLEPFRPEVPS